MLSSGNYQPQATTSQKMMKIFAFASSLVELLAVGLQTYNRACYRQFVKRIGHIIRSADHFITILSYSIFPWHIPLKNSHSQGWLYVSCPLLCCSGWLCAMWAITGHSTSVWREWVGPPCRSSHSPWRNCRWSLIISFYVQSCMSSRLKGEIALNSQ